MKGIVRRFDDLGRVVIPREIRQTLNWNTDAAVSIHVDGDKVILESASFGECVFCRTPVTEEERFMDVAVCKECRERIGKNG